MTATERLAAPTVTLKPEWAQWSGALRQTHQSPARAQLGLDTERPIVFSGHQPIVFHNGILAKLIAQGEACARTGAAPVWIVADQDHTDPGHLRLPVGTGAQLGAEVIDLLAPGTVPAGVPTASIAPQHIEPTDDPRLHALVEQINRFADTASLAEQFANATIAMACQRLGIEQPTLLFTSQLTGADTLWGLIERMTASALDCVHAYNQAARSHPDAGVRELMIEGETIELPLWGLRPDQARIAINTDNINDFGREELAPRGLLMSLLVRAQLGELFIHGTGGWAYDKITQDWARDWLGIELSPMALTTATQHLDLGFAPEQIIDPARAIWQAHHARHNPAAVGDIDTQREKDALVERIEQIHAEGRDPAPEFAELHKLLDAYRERHGEELAALDERVRVARSMQRQLELAGDRTWPFVLFDDQALCALKDAVVSALG